MVVTFPHMGNTAIVVKTLFDTLNVEFIIPPPISKKTLEIGTRCSPEMACLPLKINMGNFIESIEKGADTIVMTGGCGPCRFGYYAEVQREILKDLGYKVDVFALDVPKNDVKEFVRRVRKLIGDNNVWQAVKAVKNATQVSIELDKLDGMCNKIRPREKVKGKTDLIMKKFHHEAPKIKGKEEIISLIKKTKHELEAIALDPAANPLKIGIVGEIYTVIEPYANLNLESVLGNMGIEVDRSLTVSNWIVEHMLKPILHLKKNRPYEKAAEPYLHTMIGGHGQETIGNSVIYGQNGYDGIIQIYPLTCMPEIVAQCILPTISQDMNIPVLTLIIDELTGEAGYRTRIEAFADMLQRRKERMIPFNEYVLSGN